MFNMTSKRSDVEKRHIKGIRKRQFRDWSVFTAYLLPSAAGVALFFILPLIMLAYSSTMRSTTSDVFVGLDNYTRVLENKAFLLAAKNRGCIFTNTN